MDERLVAFLRVHASVQSSNFDSGHNSYSPVRVLFCGAIINSEFFTPALILMPHGPSHFVPVYALVGITHNKKVIFRLPPGIICRINLKPGTHILASSTIMA